MTLIIRNLADQIVDLVRDRILSGAVAYDHAIRQDALAAELGVSKIPLREALARLEEEGLVRSQANRGYFVSTLSASEANEVYELRIKLEPDSTARAALNATQADHAHAIETLETLEHVTEEHGDGVGSFNRAFHRALFRPSGQPVTVSILERLQVLSERYVRVHLEPLGRDERANQEHHQLLEAWLARDADKVAMLVEAHIRKTLDDLRQQLVDD